MIVKSATGREIELDNISGPDDDIQIGSAEYVDGIGEVSDADLDFVYEAYAEKLSEHVFQNAVGAAEAFYEGDR